MSARSPERANSQGMDRSESKSIAVSSPHVKPAALGYNSTEKECGTPLTEAATRGVSEYDLAMYSKQPFSAQSELHVLKRCFDAFDVQNKGLVEHAQAKELAEFLGEKITKNYEADFQQFCAANPKGISFDAFVEWFRGMSKKDKAAAEETFALVANSFAEKVHQQQIEIEEVGEKYTLSYRCFFNFVDLETGEKVRVSPWHDIPLYVKDVVRTGRANEPNKVNFVCEIPKWTRAKFEISTNTEFNPIKQDIKNGIPRVYQHGDMMWNYGAFPQTWESTRINFDVGDAEAYKGDNDPLDAIEIGMTQLTTGSVTAVKILGVLGMVDSGEMDWKVIVINADDPVARFLNDIDDVPKHMPGCLDAIHEWLRTYKICQGGKENKFAWDGRFMNAEYAREVTHESHLMWTNLKKILKKDTV